MILKSGNRFSEKIMRKENTPRIAGRFVENRRRSFRRRPLSD
jgi:hypothetical protein